MSSPSMTFDQVVAAALEWQGHPVDVTLIRDGITEATFSARLLGSHPLSMEPRSNDDVVLDLGDTEPTAGVFLHRKMFRGAEINQHTSSTRELLIAVDGGEISLAHSAEQSPGVAPSGLRAA